MFCCKIKAYLCFSCKLSIRLFILFIAVVLSACNTQSTRKDGPKDGDFSLRTLAKSDVDIVLEIHVRESRSLLRELMTKLYKRNPRELKKSRIQNTEKNISRLFDIDHQWRFPELEGKKDINAIRLTFADNYQGDRVFSFIAGLLSMVMKSYGNQSEFFFFDSVDPQKLYNCARNIEIAVWKLTHDKDVNDEWYIYSNSLPGEVPNLSYERLFGKLIATQDNIATIISGKKNRAIKTVIQRMATAIFLPI